MKPMRQKKAAIGMKTVGKWLVYRMRGPVHEANRVDCQRWRHPKYAYERSMHSAMAKRVIATKRGGDMSQRSRRKTRVKRGKSQHVRGPV